MTPNLHAPVVLHLCKTSLSNLCYQSFKTNLLKLLFLSFLINLSLLTPVSAQLQGIPCNAHRWSDGDGWRFNTTTQKWEIATISDQELPKGIIRCASSAETENNLDAHKHPYNSSVFSIGNNTNCFNQDGEVRGINIAGPTEGEDIIWLNYDIRPLAGTYQFQIVTNQVLGWALFHVDVPFAGPPANNTSTGTYPEFFNNADNTKNLSGDCSKLVYADCGASGNGWSTITVPSFAKPSNYYLAMWAIKDPSDLNGVDPTTIATSVNVVFKARFGCGEVPVICFLDKSGDANTNCNGNGTYTVCQDFVGGSGKWTLADDAAVKASSYTVKTYKQDGVTQVNSYTSNNLNTTPISFQLTNIGVDGPVKATICATYAEGNNYNISLTGSPPDGAPANFLCETNGNFSGTAPLCCPCKTLNISAPLDVDLGCNPTDVDDNNIPDVFEKILTLAEIKELLGLSTEEGCNVDITYKDVKDLDKSIGCEVEFVRTFTATAACGNLTKSVSQRFKWKYDKTPPVIYCPADITVSCIGDVPDPDVDEVTATDNCGKVNVSFVKDSSTGSCPKYIYRTYKAVDDCGNTSYCTQKITVDDKTPPYIKCPADITVSCIGDVPDPDVDEVTASDNCGKVTVTFVKDSSTGSCPKYIYRTYKAADDCGNTSYCTQKITVDDKIPPYIKCPADITVSCIGDVPDPDVDEGNRHQDNCGKVKCKLCEG
jgi:hypothetical protein